MAKIIIVGNQKGGAGKSTVVSMVANALANAPYQHKVLLVDADIQQSIIKRRLGDVRFIEGVTPYEVVYKNIAQFQKDIKQLDQEYEYIIIDPPGKLDVNLPADQQEVTKFLLYADHLFIPFAPGNYVVESTIDFLKVALQIKKVRKSKGADLEITGFINMFENRTLDDQFLVQEIEELQDMFRMEFMDKKLHRYALFRNVDTISSFYEEQSSDRAKRNFSKWFNEFYKIVNDG
ncbi:ParA family protein [Flavilitoribacter nigricans]|uniref:CobQ/CobB/MinD/ParA nucleotide binding domain-containing protein n=1 Tax=Flavilitoribacter nigricans (strain ATCC 23147 / DSM 23189 / NBRC 102662 / NCIMB 1420 / SS-2) TaxID=1122177 RepID=A0A2D0NHZ3_FLAN2|nr:ParA family protein [Flavilitoribacter nigricans]PHN07789.1 hypothetical protein CRP01_04520 [Flavilitoribacter nigricans DSM 23189 = NBRC 102662]